MSVWDEIIGQCAEDVSPFNDYLLKDFRRVHVDNIPVYLDNLFKECMKLIPHTEEKIEYIGYRVLSPEERIEHVKNSENGQVPIQDYGWVLYAYEFKMGNKIYGAKVYVPYLVDGYFIIKSVKYSPKFAIVENGIHHIADGIIIKVMRSPITVWRSERYRIESLDSSVYNEYVITIKAYHGASARGIKTPLISYNLAAKGLVQSLKDYGLEDEVEFLEEPGNDTYYAYFKCNDKVYLKTTKDVLKDVNKLRFITSLIFIFRNNHKFTLKDILDENCGYFQLTLGYFIGGSKQSEHQALIKVIDHLSSTNDFLDVITKNSLKNIGLECDDIYDLFRQIFFNISKWLSEYTAGDLENKKLNVLDHLLSDFVKIVFTRIYNIIKNPKGKNLGLNIVNALERVPSKKATDLYDSVIIECSPTSTTGNLLLTGYTKRVRTLLSAEGRNKGGSVKIPTSELLLHKSVAPIEAIMDVPSSSPVESGSIVPSLQITEDGRFIISDELKEILSKFPK